ncbi:MAG: Rpn family recombination-promoting nuclease/putative transposase [Faecalimonas sp.]|nr:Rpn family recombination-promoting nuclease/putative transposase [Faecalimonas sp.]
MSNGHTAVSEFLENKVRFADLFNGSLFQGQQIVKPEELEAIKGESDILVEDKAQKIKNVHRYRDIVMRWNKDAYLAIFACEVQSKVHYAMPVRKMLYDALAYLEQTKNTWEMRQALGEEKITGTEYLSKFHKEDKLTPIITAVFYYGVDEWDGSTDLYGMFEGDAFLQNDIVKKYIPNYAINLIDAGRIEDVGCFQTELQEIFGMLKYRQDKDALLHYMNEHRDYFHSVDGGTSRAIAGLLQSRKMLKEFETKTGTEGEEDMCKALDDLYQEGIEKGIEKGIEQERAHTEAEKRRADEAEAENAELRARLARYENA